MLRHRPAVIAVVMLLAACAATTACAAAPESVLVLAAASTIDALEAAVAEFNAAGTDTVEVSFGPTSVLARQIEEGAPADLFLSASVDWADYVVQRAPVAERTVLVANRLTVIAPSGAAPRTLDELAHDPAVGRIAVADPASVPAGVYAAQALRSAGLWELVEPRLIPALDVRAALAMVAGGEADAGLVYATDAASTGAVSVVATIDPALHDRIEYPLLLLGEARPGGRRFFDYLRSAAGRAHFLRRGFRAPDS